MAEFFTSGLCGNIFYTQHEINIDADYEAAFDSIEFNLDLLAESYSKDLGFKYEDEEDKKLQVDAMFWEDVGSNVTFYEPIVFDEKIATECFLIPLTYDEKSLLSLPCHGSIDLTPRLDAYQLITHCSIDKDSRFFSINDARGYFASALLGQKTIDKALKVVALLPTR